MSAKLVLPKLIKIFDSQLDKIISEDLKVLKEIKSYVIASGGKRIRPLTHYLVTKLLAYQGDQWKDVGAVAELIHAASLLHDDVVDNASQRRGKQTVGARFGNKTAILAGDYLLACGINRLNALGNPKIMSLFSQVLKDLSVSELLQMEWEKKPAITLKIYDSIIYGKTASLFGACTASAAILCGLNEKETKSLSEFGIRLGKLFQKKDDCLDYFYASSESGKDKFKDFHNGLFTYPILILKRDIPNKFKKSVDSLVAKPEKTSNDERQILQMLSDYQIEQKLTNEFKSETEYFYTFISQFPDSAEKTLFQSQIEKLT
ncbi:polyprenyl synthetase [Leptospira ryugenii]|uniref:Polyprenyl synthetase n=1 Tax=Leptospira ryugenii TaxID=1917863 RepID=A0A2P2DZL8_9LEPT|nr:polyprenyl synthetase family protein [Leptospira ryugenii]GBF50063.1 polyprenyl synthetase [Leptospira ryugenii]